MHATLSALLESAASDKLRGVYLSVIKYADEPCVDLRPFTQMSHKKRAMAGKLYALGAPTQHAALEWSLHCLGAALAGHYYSL